MSKIIKGGVEHFFGGGSSSASIDVLDTMTEINANIESNKAAGALAVKELNSMVNTKISTSRKEAGVRHTNDTSAERSRFRGYVAGTSGNPVLGFEHFMDNETTTSDKVLFYFDGAHFVGQGKKDNGADISKRLATYEEIQTMQSNFQAGYSTIADAITEKGITIADNASPEEIAEAIRQITGDEIYVSDLISVESISSIKWHSSGTYNVGTGYDNAYLVFTNLRATLNDVSIRINQSYNKDTGIISYSFKTDTDYDGNFVNAVNCRSVQFYVIAYKDNAGGSGSGGGSSTPEVKSETYTVTLTGGQQSQKHSGTIDVSSLGTVLGYGVTSLSFGYNCYFNQVDNFHASCSLANGILTVSLNVSGNTDPYAANYITGNCSATVVVFYA